MEWDNQEWWSGGGLDDDQEQMFVLATILKRPIPSVCVFCFFARQQSSATSYSPCYFPLAEEMFPLASPEQFRLTFGRGSLIRWSIPGSWSVVTKIEEMF